MLTLLLAAQPQRTLPAKSIPYDADKDPAHGPGNVPCSKGQKGLHHLDRSIMIWKEVLAQEIGQRSVHSEVIPFKPVAQGSCNKFLVDLKSKILKKKKKLYTQQTKTDQATI